MMHTLKYKDWKFFPGEIFIFMMFDLEQIAMLWSNRKEGTWIGD